MVLFVYLSVCLSVCLFGAGGEDSAPFMPVETMAALFAKSKEGRARAAELATPYTPSVKLEMEAIPQRGPGSTASSPAVPGSPAEPGVGAMVVKQGSHDLVWMPDPLVRSSYALNGWKALMVGVEGLELW